MAATQDPRANVDNPALDPNRPLEPRVPMNAEHESPITSLLILAGFVAVVLIGGWMLSGPTGGPAIAVNQATPPAMQITPAPPAAPARSTTGAAPAR